MFWNNTYEVADSVQSPSIVPFNPPNSPMRPYYHYNCVSYLLLHSKLSQTQQLKANVYYVAQLLSGVWQQLG